MIITSQNEAINNLNLESQSFSVEENSVLFWVMSNALYTYKERAVLRELAANGWDAHKAINKQDTPIVIRLPTAMEPELVFQDFGTGMSKQILEDFYFAYFKSTKRLSNDSIGGFGVGCKTPFILSETYNIETVCEGIKNVALSVLDAGIPKAIYVSQTPTDEPNGTTIRIPVSEPEVIKRLYKEVETLFINWPVPPIVTKGTSEKFNIRSNTYSSFNDYIYLDRSRYFGITSYVSYFNNVTIGMFEYTIPSTLKERVMSRLLVDTKERFDLKLRAIYNIIGGSSINFVISIGEIQLSPSRESIEDTTENADILIKYLRKASDDILAKITNELPKVLDAYVEMFSTDIENLNDFITRRNKIFNEFSPDLVHTIGNYLYNQNKIEPEDVLKIKTLTENEYFTNNCCIHRSGETQYKFKEALDVDNFLHFHIHHKLNSSVDAYIIDLGKIFRSKKAWRPALYKENEKTYVISGKPTAIVKYLNHFDTSTITVDGQTVDFSNIIGIDSVDILATINKILEGYVIELDASKFVIPKGTTLSRKGITKSKADEIDLFTVLYDGTDKVTKDKTYKVSDWYELDFPKTTNFIIFEKSNKSYNESLGEDLIKLLGKNKLPLVVLESERSSEKSTQRYEKFFKDFASIYHTTKYTYSSDSQYVWIYDEIYSKNKDTLRSYITAKNTLKFTFRDGFADSENLSFLSIYRMHRRNGLLKILCDLMGEEHYKKLLRLIAPFIDKSTGVGMLSGVYQKLFNPYRDLIPRIDIMKVAFTEEEKKAFNKKLDVPYELSMEENILRSLSDMGGENSVKQTMWFYKNSGTKELLKNRYKQLTI